VTALAAILEADEHARAALVARLDRIEAQQAQIVAALERGPSPRRRLSRAETAKHYGVSERSVDTWLAAGAPCLRLGGRGGSPRLDPEELDRWHREQSEPETAAAE
jgi:hypothetical protein